MTKKIDSTGWTVLLAVVLFLCLSGALMAYNSFCEDCYIHWVDGKTPELSFLDAQCCTTGSIHCDIMEQDDWDKQLWNAQWCANNWDGYRYTCSGQSYSCTSGGGGGGGGGGFGGGGGSCHIQLGTLCPATCFSCTYFLF